MSNVTMKRFFDQGDLFLYNVFENIVTDTFE